MVVFEQSGCIRAKVNLFGHKWLYSGKKCSDRAEVVLFGQKWLYLGKVVVIG